MQHGEETEEADFAGCAKANEYILHGEGTAKEATEALGFRIYCTDEMQALIEWMHEYNMTAGKENQIQISPKALYDGMIFVYEATPTNPWES